MSLTNGRAALLAATIVLVCSPAQAVILAPGMTAPLPGTTSAAEPHLAGVVLVDEIIPFSFFDGVSGGDILGHVQQRVVRSSVDGTIDFYWRVFNDASSSAAIQSFRFGEFFSPEYDADYRIDGLGVRAPDTAHRFAGAFDSYVNFNFLDLGLLPGQDSNFLLMDTTATYYAKTAFFDLANIGHTSISDSFDAYTPAPIPEPTTLALLGLGLAGVAARRRRR